MSQIKVHGRNKEAREHTLQERPSQSAFIEDDGKRRYGWPDAKQPPYGLERPRADAPAPQPEEDEEEEHNGQPRYWPVYGKTQHHELSRPKIAARYEQGHGKAKAKTRNKKSAKPAVPRKKSPTARKKSRRKTRN
jgi:hypothetical protein